MRITPLDIRKQPFKQTFRGYDPYAVRAFLEELAKQDEELIRQNNEFATEIKGLKQLLEKYVSIERTLNETLMTAQKLSDDAKISAQKEAELIIKDAQIRADRYEDESRQRVNTLEGEVMALRNQRDTFLARFKSILKTQLELVDVISGDLKKEDSPAIVNENQIQQPKTVSMPAFQSFTKKMPIVQDRAVEDDTIDDVPPQPVIL